MAGMPFGHSPVDIGETKSDPPSGLGWAFGILVCAQALLLAFNSHALTNWANQQAVSPLSAPVLQAIDQWQQVVASAGLDQPVRWGQSAWHEARAARWPGQPAPATAHAKPQSP